MHGHRCEANRQSDKQIEAQAKSPTTVATAARSIMLRVFIVSAQPAHISHPGTMITNNDCGKLENEADEVDRHDQY